MDQRTFMRTLQQVSTLTCSSALVNAVGKDGKSIFTGKKATAFSNAEEELLHGTEVIFLLMLDRFHSS